MKRMNKEEKKKRAKKDEDGDLTLGGLWTKKVITMIKCLTKKENPPPPIDNRSYV